MSAEPQFITVAVPSAAVELNTVVPQVPRKHQTRNALLLMVAAHFCFTVMMVCIKLGSELEQRAFPSQSGIGPWEAVVFRCLPMAIVCAVVVARERKKATAPLPAGSYRWLLIRGFIGAVSMACLFYGSIHVPLAIVSLFSNSNVFFIGILAHVFLNERMTWTRALCTLFGFLGVALVLGDGLYRTSLNLNSVSNSRSSFDFFVAFLSGFFAAVAYFSVRKMKALSGSLIILSLALAGLVLAGVGIAFEGFHWPQSQGALLLLAASSVPAILGQFLMTWSFQNAEAGLVSTGQYAGPVFAALFGVFLFAERLSGLEVAGAALALFFGVMLPLLGTRACAHTRLGAKSS